MSTFLNGSARAQAVGHDVDEPTFDGPLLLLGAVLVLAIVASFSGTAKASGALGRRSGAGEGVRLSS